MPEYKLMYFNGRGRAEVARMLFTLKGEAFEDYRFKDGEWPTFKGNADVIPMGQVPVLLIDGKPMPHSRAISQYLARVFGLYGANNAEAGQIDVICETVQELSSKIMRLLSEKDETKKAEGLANFRDKTSKPFLPWLNSAIKKAGGKFFVGTSETLADVVGYAMLDALVPALGEEYFQKNYPDLIKFRQGITQNSKLSDYIKNRPQTAI